jgi:putative hemolysin
MTSDPDAKSLFSRIKQKIAPTKKPAASQQLVQQIAELHRKKQITDAEFSMLAGSINFSHKMAREVMVPRTDAFMVDLNDDFQKNLDEILREPYSRIPVFDQDRDKIVGIIHIRSILRRARQLGFDQLTYQDVMTEPLFAAETIELSDLLLQMQDSQKQLAILTDEFGGVTGLATIEDLIEEIVGEIDDEVDQSEVLVHKLAADQYTIYGKMPLSEFNDYFKLNLALDNVDTVAGYVITKLGLIPAKGQKLTVALPNGYKLTTGRMKGSRLITLLLTIPKEKSEAADLEHDK